jgi:Uncharacterized protein conserved in bacteria (DUF2242).
MRGARCALFTHTWQPLYNAFPFELTLRLFRSTMFTSFSKATAATLLGLLTLAACSSAPQPKFQQELFETGASPYARNFNSSTTDTCEAARRALLSQGYLTTMTRTDTVDGTKNFQPTGDTHVVVEFHVVCTPGEEASDTSIAYVNAVQNGFALKKSDTSASVGLSVLGSLSLPIRSNSDAMVKISSETIPSGKFTIDSSASSITICKRWCAPSRLRTAVSKRACCRCRCRFKRRFQPLIPRYLTQSTRLLRRNRQAEPA